MPPKKITKKLAPKAKAVPRGMAKPISPGLVMIDLMKKQWKLGPVIGQGGFGYIYLGAQACSGDVTETNADYVIKVEPHLNGPLFVELAFYQRVAKADMVNPWMKSRKISHLGIPLYIGTGSFDHDNNKYRFMVMNRFGMDVEKLFLQCDSVFTEKTVYSLGLRIVDVLEYIHEHEYVHADIKASNLMMGCKKADASKVYLLDYGLAYRYYPNGKHVLYKEDPRRKHDGTIEYTSRDAHKGCAPSRRGDMEILGYCMVQWLCRKLPWEDNLQDKDKVLKEKEKYMGNIKEFMAKCFSDGNKPDKLQEYLEIVNKMGYTDKPDYVKIRQLFELGMKHNGITDDGKSVWLSTGRSPRKRRTIETAVSPRKPRDALRELPVKPSPRKARANIIVADTSNHKKRLQSPAKNSPAKNSPAKKPPPSSPVRKARTPPRRKLPSYIEASDSDESLEDDNDDEDYEVDVRLNIGKRGKSPAKKRSPVKKVKGNPPPQGVSEISQGTKNISNSKSYADKEVIINGVKKTVHQRVRRKNVPTRDFAQSP